MIIIKVKPGDTLWQLSEKYQIPLAEILAVNGFENPDQLSVGQTVLIPTQDSIHIVKPGESLYSIAKNRGISLNQLLQANPGLTAPYTIYPGDELKIPAIGQKPRRTIEVNGYVYPGVQEPQLAGALPNLTYLAIFSYQARANGSLIPIDDEPLIRQAKAARVAPMLVVTNTTEGGGFDSDIIHALVTDSVAANRLFENLLGVLNAKGYYGLNVDFEYIPETDREAYNRFLANMHQRISVEGGYPFFTALAPKESDEQRGRLYEAHDYAFNGRIADRVILMTYEWGYLYGPPLPVAPMDGIRRVLDYAVTRIPSDKIMMSLPGYAYDWTLPYQPGSAARHLSIVQATQLAAEKHVQIQFDPESITPFFTYVENGREHIVWFDDAISAEAKLLLIDEYDLAGVSYWTLNQLWPQNWAVLRSLYNVKKVL